MKVACLQFAPEVGQVDKNIERANKILDETRIPSDLQWLVLPELALTGYNFKSEEHIRPFLEPTAAGVSTKWAQSMAHQYQCLVTVGYPEITVGEQPPKRYNSTVTVSPTGEIVGHYRKTFLYYTDDNWASEGDKRFFNDVIPGIGKVSMGICMDINPYKFVAPWTEYEFAQAAIASNSPYIVLSMAWITRMEPSEIAATAHEPDGHTLAYWLERFRPIIDNPQPRPVTLIMANRCGQEDDVCYAGSSTVISIENGAVSLYDIAGVAEEKCLVVDLGQQPNFTVRMGPSIAPA